MRRRSFLSALSAVVAPAAPLLTRPRSPAPASADGVAGRILTVAGPIDPGEMGTTLVHEHVLVDFVGAGSVSRSRYDAEEAFRTVLPHLQELRKRGCRTLVECTPAYLGRDPLLLRRLSAASGLHIVTNAGYYGAWRDRFVPAHAHRETSRQLADRWTGELRRGIEGTGIRPGFLKIGIDSGTLSGVDRKLVEAAALCHLDTGLTIAVHTGDGRAALDTVHGLKALGVSPEAYVWVHAGNEADRPTHDWLAREGAFVEFDKLGPSTLADHVAAVLDMADRGLLGRVLVSQDAGWYNVGTPGGGTYRPHTFLFDRFLPALRARGCGEDEIRAILVENPAKAFAIRRRALARDA